MVMRVLPVWEISAPRLPFEKSYSVLILFHLIWRCATSRNKPDFFTAQYVNDYQDSSDGIHTNCDEALLVFRIGTQLMDGERIVEDALCIGERDSVLLQIACSLG